MPPTKKKSPAKPPAPPAPPTPAPEQEPTIDGAAATFRTLAKTFSKHALTDKLRAYFTSLHSRELCLQRGRSVATPPVIADALQIFSAAAPFVRNKPLPGFGPLRFLFALESAQKHAAAFDDMRVRTSQKLGASTTKGSVRTATHRAVSDFADLLLAAVPPNSPLWNEINNVSTASAKNSVELSSNFSALTALSKKLFDAAKTDPDLALVLTDMDITQESIALLSRQVREALDADSAHASSKTDVAAGSDELNFLDGLLWLLLDDLIAAMERARRNDASLPELHFVHLHRAFGTRRKKAPSPTPTPAPTPA